MSRAKAVLALSFLFLSVSFTSCATQETFQVRVMRPAPVNLGQHDLVAVDNFTGEGADQMAEELTSALRSAKNPLTGKADFEILDRGEVDEMLDQMRNSRGSKWDEDAMVVLKRWRSADVLLKGSIAEYRVADDVSEDQWVDRLSGETRSSYTRRAQARVRITLEALDGDKVFDRVEMEEVASATTNANDEEPAEIDHEPLLANARQKIIERYMKRIMPHFEWVSVRLFHDGDLPELKIGNGYAKTGDWPAALESYSSANERATGKLADRRFKAQFNMGVAYQYTNQFDLARHAFKQAYALNQDSSILTELKKVNRREQEIQTLKQQGQAATPQR